MRKLGPTVPLLLGVFAVGGALRLSPGELTNPGPGMWPLIVAVMVTATAAILFFADDPADYEPWTLRSARIVGGFVALSTFILLFQTIGFLVPAFLMLALWLRVFGEEPWRWTVSLAAAGALALYLIFVVALGVPFPADILVTGG